MDADLSANYKFDRRNSLRLTYGLSYTNPSQAARNPNLVFSDMIDAVQGNPGLHRYSRNRVNLDYTLLLTNGPMDQPFCRIHPLCRPDRGHRHAAPGRGQIHHGQKLAEHGTLRTGKLRRLRHLQAF